MSRKRRQTRNASHSWDDGRGRKLLYGRQAVREALRAGRRSLHALYLAQGIKSSPVLDDIHRLAEARGVLVEQVERRVLDEWLGHTHHQGVALAAGPYPYATPFQALTLARERGEDPFLLLLDRVQDPQNLGSLLRTAEACGVHGVIFPRHRAAEVTPAVVNASSGAVEHLLVCQETNLVRTMNELKKEGLWLAGLERRDDAIPFDKADLSGPLGVVVGSEGFGLSRLVAETCDWLLALPMKGRINSLNAAVAGSILIFHVMQQRLNR
ncbi:MAG: 23S rRNA (guanosine(2251)-2'-O)-methyltransferase RlmB [Chloroflexi bacterium]|nr:23S rRNA (guanosine(2251)-2'-O)-methyltransferase RlmB [Chloroflexota bacterium]